MIVLNFIIICVSAYLGQERIGKFIYFFPFYLFGAYIGIYGKNYVESNWSQQIGLKKRFLFICCLLMSFITYLSQNSILLYLYICIAIIVIWLIIPSIQNKNIKVILLLNDFEFIIYCMHFLILTPIEKIIGIITHYSFWGATVAYFVSPFITVSVVIVCALLFKKIFPNIYSFITGNR